MSMETEGPLPISPRVPVVSLVLLPAGAVLLLVVCHRPQHCRDAMVVAAVLLSAWRSCSIKIEFTGYYMWRAHQYRPNRPTRV